MHRLLSTGLAGVALAGGLVGFAPHVTASDFDCDDPAHPIHGVGAPDVAVGTKKVKTAYLVVYTPRGCAIKGAVAVVTSPRRTYRITLTKGVGDEDDPTVRWRGAVRIKPSELRNSDAGVWTVRYEVDGGTPATSETTTADAHVRRATRLSFNAGPEPVRHHKLTFAGTLERADWNSHHYRPVSKPVAVQTAGPGDSWVDVVSLTTKKNGTYHTTTTVPGAGAYRMHFDGGTVSAPSASRVDLVAAP